MNFGIAKKLDQLNIGASLELMQLQITEYGSKYIFLFDIGAQSNIIPKLIFALNISNISQSRITETFPSSIIRIGLKYESSEKVDFYAEIDKYLEDLQIIRAGVEYQIIKSMYLRSGVQIKPIRSHFGLAFSHKRVLFEYGFSIHSFLGNTHGLSLSYEIR